MSALTKDALTAFARENRARFEGLLRDFVECPTVSVDPDEEGRDRGRREAGRRDDPRLRRERRPSTSRAATRSSAACGATTRRVPPSPSTTTSTSSPPRRRPSRGRRSPFVFTKKGDRYFGRGTTDDKGPALSALFGAKAAVDAGVPVNVRVLWEFEEEIGSPSFAKGVAGAADALATDSVIVSDTIWIARGKPAAPAGLRGLQGLLFTLETGTTDQHSGVTGGAARNPIAELMQLVSECFDAKTGRVKIPGFYDDVVAPSKAELEDFRRSGFTVAGFKKDHLFKSIRTNDALDVMKRIWAMPTFEVHGVVGGYTGPGVKTIIPPRAEVKISCRLVPNQTGAKITKLVTAFVKKKNPDVKVHLEGRLDPYRASRRARSPTRSEAR